MDSAPILIYNAVEGLNQIFMDEKITLWENHLFIVQFYVLKLELFTKS
jgi:hypothetical protein